MHPHSAGMAELRCSEKFQQNATSHEFDVLLQICDVCNTKYEADGLCAAV